MDMKNEQIPPFILSDIYRNSITIIEEENITQTVLLPNKNLLYLGENKKQIIILVDEENTLHLQDDSYTFLSSILNACKLNMADVAIINCNKQTINYAIIKEQLKPSYCIVFGNAFQNVKIPASISLYEPTLFENTTYLLASELSVMKLNTQEAKIEKSKLWVSLKKIFNI